LGLVLGIWLWPELGNGQGIKEREGFDLT